MITPEQVVSEARGWLGVPFLHQGRNSAGVDCVGLPIVVGQALGLVPPKFDVPNYGREPTGAIVGMLLKHCTRIPQPKPGTLVVIAWSRIAAHTAICTGDTLIHAYESAGGVVEHGYRGRWVRMTHSAWELPGVTYV